jgi:actin-like protein 6A
VIKHQAPAVFLAKHPGLTAFASGKATALVVDLGARGTTVTAVHDGYALTKSSLRTPLGGDLLTEMMLKSIEKQVRLLASHIYNSQDIYRVTYI